MNEVTGTTKSIEVEGQVVGTVAQVEMSLPVLGGSGYEVRTFWLASNHLGVALDAEVTETAARRRVVRAWARYTTLVG